MTCTEPPTTTTSADVARWFEQRAPQCQPPEDLLQRFADVVNDGRQYLARIEHEKAFDAVLLKARQAAHALSEALPELISLLQFYRWKTADWIERLQQLETALDGSRLRKPPRGRPTVKWADDAATLLGIMEEIQSATGCRFSHQKRVAILCDALKAMDGAEHDVGATRSILKRDHIVAKRPRIKH
jgi:hypothetical protein